MRFTRSSGAAMWLGVSVTSIAFMGIYAFLVALARTPGFNELFPDEEFFRTALITHVALALVIWFLAFIIFTMHYVSLDAPTKSIDRIAALGAMFGIALIVITPFTGPANPILNNYVPTLDRPLYLAGITVFFIFAALGAVFRAPAVLASDNPLITRGTLVAAGGALISALLCFALAYVAISAAGGKEAYDPQYYYEMIYWGGGHVLQFANTLGLMAVWAVLIKRLTGEAAVSDKVAIFILGLVTILIISAPLQYFFLDHDDPMLRRFFTLLKAWGLSFGPLILGVSAVMKWGKMKKEPVAQAGFFFALLLFALGGVIALLIEGSDTRVPAHYHGVIGGVTISFMTLAIIALMDNGWLTGKEKWKKFQLKLYGIGQAMFVSGLFIGGLAGLGRKTFGAAQKLDTALKYTGMSVMGIGGLLAVISGSIFVMLMIGALGRSGKRFD